MEDQITVLCGKIDALLNEHNFNKNKHRETDWDWMNDPDLLEGCLSFGDIIRILTEQGYSESDVKDAISLYVRTHHNPLYDNFLD
ncbi:MAG: hypothetical protein IK130_04475 [Oscillospiraceae bacterium]|nr:hypothetical protein [Oscillospiraceae bacterium]